MEIQIKKKWIEKEEYKKQEEIDMRCVKMVEEIWNEKKLEDNEKGKNKIG